MAKLQVGDFVHQIVLDGIDVGHIIAITDEEITVNFERFLAKNQRRFYGYAYAIRHLPKTTEQLKLVDKCILDKMDYCNE